MAPFGVGGMVNGEVPARTQFGACFVDGCPDRAPCGTCVSTAVVGVNPSEELRADLGALSVRLDEDAVERLNRIWPGTGEAPQAYAW